MKKLALGILFLPLVAMAQTVEWLDPQVNAINRAQMHANYFAYESDKAAEGGCKKNSSNYLSLNGIWKFNWVKDAENRPVDFWKEKFDDRAWVDMKVPALWELNGYGDPIYVNTSYAWRNHFKSNPPIVPTEQNNVGSYRKEIEVSKDWKGKKIIAHFGSVTSNIYLWVNGKYVGYSEDSKLEAEFDITKYLKTGKNLIAFQVFRWCDGTYLEDQDFFRLSGVGRDCYLYARDKKHISDIRITPDLDASYNNGTLNVNLDVVGGGNVDLKLFDSKGVLVTEKKVPANSKEPIKLDVASPLKWTAETPNLYTLKAYYGEEIIPVKVGFRKVELKGNQVLVNGQPVIFKGANRHELNPDNGYVVSREDMIGDIKTMKELNINAVRTCHYPNDNLWYELCDEYGIYVVAEANVESHGMGYGDRTLAKDPQFLKAHLERNQRNVQRGFNHASIIFWSLGNEAGFGPNFEECYKWIKAEDPSRPVQYERAGHNEFTDIYCPMYASYGHCEDYSKKATKPLIQCEYAHAMGNSLGGFKEYMELIRKYPAYQGGFIWDFVDQSLRWKNKDRKMIFAYGGDFNTADGSDNNFCNNGLVSPDRQFNPHAHEAAYYYQNVLTAPIDLEKGLVSIYNENFFIDLSNYRLHWEILRNGISEKSGVVESLKVDPQAKTAISLGYAPIASNGDELLLNVKYMLKDKEPLLQAGTVVAYEQMEIAPYTPGELEIVAKKNISTSYDGVNTIVSAEGFSAKFNNKNGYLNSYVIDGKELIATGSELRPNFWRAPTDNDFGANLQNNYILWNNPNIILKSFESVKEGNLVSVKASYEIEALKATLQLQYTVNSRGEIKVTQSMTADKEAKMPNLFRFGMRVALDNSLSNVSYYGRGPIENYVDRQGAAKLGLYNQTVEEQYYHYIRPQEGGARTDLRWLKVLTNGKRGIELTCSQPFSASAIDYSMESLDDGKSKDQRHIQEVEKSKFTELAIDKAQMGVACINSWGALPLPQYMLPYGDYSYSFVIKPIR